MDQSARFRDANADAGLQMPDADGSARLATLMLTPN